LLWGQKFIVRGGNKSSTTVVMANHNTETTENKQCKKQTWIYDCKITTSTQILSQLKMFLPAKVTTHIRLMALCLGLPRWAGTRKVKPIWILLEQETVSGSGISWAICKSAPRSRQITTPAPHHSVSTGRMPFLPPNQQRQSTESKLQCT